MTGVDDLAAFVRAQLDAREQELAEDQRVALAAAGDTSGRWERTGPDPDQAAIQTTEADDWAMIVYDEGSPTPEQAAHIVRWDPARALREVEDGRRNLEAKRRILAECVRTMEHEDYGHWLAEQVIRTLAQPYAGHPDFRADWLAQVS